MSTLQRITSFQFQSHGAQFPDYFQGAGVCGTAYDEIVTGAGNSEREASHDAIEMLCTRTTIRDNDIDCLECEANHASTKQIEHEDTYEDDRTFYVSLRYCIESAD